VRPYNSHFFGTITWLTVVSKPWSKVEPMGSEVVQPSKEVLAIDGEPAPFHAGVGGQHAVGDITHGHTRG
jgi:hypothetical protein